MAGGLHTTRASPKSASGKLGSVWIVGPRTQEQLDSALRALQLELSEELLTSLDEIFPGPGPSPEAFAW